MSGNLHIEEGWDFGEEFHPSFFVENIIFSYYNKINGGFRRQGGVKQVMKKKMSFVFLAFLVGILVSILPCQVRAEEPVDYYGAAEPPVRCGESHLSGLTEPPHFVY